MNLLHIYIYCHLFRFILRKAANLQILNRVELSAEHFTDDFKKAFIQLLYQWKCGIIQFPSYFGFFIPFLGRGKESSISRIQFTQKLNSNFFIKIIMISVKLILCDNMSPRIQFCSIKVNSNMKFEYIHMKFFWFCQN